MLNYTILKTRIEITNHALIQRSESAALRKYPPFAPGKYTGSRWVISVVWPVKVATIERLSTFQHWIERPAITRVQSSCSIQIRKMGLLSTFHWLKEIPLVLNWGTLHIYEMLRPLNNTFQRIPFHNFFLRWSTEKRRAVAIPTQRAYFPCVTSLQLMYQLCSIKTI